MLFSSTKTNAGRRINNTRRNRTKKEQNLKGNVNQWKVLNTIKVRGDYPIYSIAIHPNDDIIASACGYDGIQEFDIYSGELLNITMSNHHSVIAVAYDCSGESLICGE